MMPSTVNSVRDGCEYFKSTSGSMPPTIPATVNVKPSPIPRLASFVQAVADMLASAAALKTCVLKSAIGVVVYRLRAPSEVSCLVSSLVEAEKIVLVTFKTSAWSDITMFGTAATAILKMMGQSGNVPGALLANDIPDALQSLNRALEQQAREESTQAQADDDSEDRPVSLHTRATPLIELFEAAAAKNENVMWEEG